LFSFHENSLAGVSPDPRWHPRAMFHGNGMSRFGAWPKRVRSAGTGSPVRSCARAAVSRSAVESDASTRFGAAILHREDVEFVGRKPETGGTPTPPGVEFVRYRRSLGRGFRQTAPKTPRMAVRAVFRALGGHGARIAATSRPRNHPRADPQALAGHGQPSRLAVH